MVRDESGSSAPIGRRAVFDTTHWSVVRALADGDSSLARQALAKLCQTYWYPLYAYVRRRGYSAHDAQDLTQAFFARLLERESLGSANAKLGKFRTFILTALQHFLTSEWRQAKALKRGGGGGEFFSLDWARAEERFDLEPACHASPDRLFEKQWALNILDGVLNRLTQEYQSDGKTELFAALKLTLMGRRESQPYAILAAKLCLSESAVKVTLHRLRKRYRELVREAVADTVEDPREVEAELRYLFQALAV